MGWHLVDGFFFASFVAIYAVAAGVDFAIGIVRLAATHIYELPFDIFKISMELAHVQYSTL